MRVHINRSSLSSSKLYFPVRISESVQRWILLEKKWLLVQMSHHKFYCICIRQGDFYIWTNFHPKFFRQIRVETVLVFPLNSKSLKHLTSDLSQWMHWPSSKLLMLLNHVSFYVLFSDIINFYGKLNKLMKWTVYRHEVAIVAHPIGFIWYVYYI